ncbi:MAG: M4 family metallopeptidase [Bacteroidales bacterium]|nr:M4 family metallopeptidase [Bacteroidales bacterium]
MKKYFVVLLFIFTINFYYAQKEFYGNEANRIIEGSQIVYYNNNNPSFPTYIKFKDATIHENFISQWLNKYSITAKKIQTETDALSITHHKYQQFLDSIPIEWAVFSFHCKDNQVLSFSGTLWKELKPINTIALTPQQAITIAKTLHPAEVYMWEDTLEESCLKQITNNSKATYYPMPRLVYFKTAETYALTYKVTIYSKKPLSKKDYYIDANSGKLIKVINKIYTNDVIGTAETKYSGTQTITTNLYNGIYRLRETTRGNGIFTFNMQLDINYANAIDFTDNDNYWNNYNANLDEVATDAHWATQKYYDYFYTTFNRNSIDNNGFALYNYVHADLVGMGFPNNVNAFWDGTRMTYGDGNATYSPLTTVDIVAHEITHGLTEFTANLVYADESGALNEGFSDIFATVIEFYAKPSQANWTLGEDIGVAFRSLANPNLFYDPDTYMGNFWDFNNEVHQNSTVFSHWFYLLVNGGSGTNDLGNSYQVSGIGIAKAAQIAYRTLVYYLPSTATYADARFFTIMSAIDLYGACSPEVESTTNAMYAIGLGNPYQNQVIANFNAVLTQNCQAPFSVQFNNESINGQSFYWDFGDGNNSTQLNPLHTYTDTGNFSVTLIVNGGNCGSDTLTLNNYISISSTNPCVVIMPLTGTANTITSCQGTLFDGGGPNGNYADNSDAIITISPNNANKVILTFTFFDIEAGSGSFCDYDYVEIFDGPNTSSPSLGRYCNTTGSPGTIESTGHSLTILLHSDQYLTKQGFAANWTCQMLNVAPTANFDIQPINTCSGLISFVDLSLHNPSSWLWIFGDGTTSTEQNPIHEYLHSGTYDVTLIVSNTNGTDTLYMPNAVQINRPEIPIIHNDTICENQSAMLFTNSNNGTLLWYYHATDTIPFYTGDTLITPPLSQNTTYWIQNALLNPAQYVGDTRSSSDGSYFSNSTIHYLVFDCYTQCKLVSVEVNAATSAYRTISLKNSSDNTLAQRNIFIPQGISRITLNIDLPIQNNLRLAGPANPNLWRNNNLIAYYPYTLPGILSIKHSSAQSNPTGYYYYFYNWEIKLPDCYSTKAPITVYVENCTQLDYNETISFSLFPNPAKDFAILSTNQAIQAISVFDITGKNIPVTLIMLNNNQYKLNLSNFDTGMYLIYLTINNRTYVKKVSVCRFF